jgi:hypothetical protein
VIDALFEELVERDELREVAEEAMNASLGTTMFGMVYTKIGREICSPSVFLRLSYLGPEKRENEIFTIKLSVGGH